MRLKLNRSFKEIVKFNKVKKRGQEKHFFGLIDLNLMVLIDKKKIKV